MRTHDRAGRGSDPTEREGEEVSQGSDRISIADPDRARNHYFDSLSRAEQEGAIRRMRRDGYSELAIAAATRLSIEMINQILAKPAA